jgi:parvulin-like peptidyl-prolyl isomerase
MLSRAQRRHREKQKKTTSEALVEKKKANPWLYAGSVLILVVIVVTFVGSPAVRSANSGMGGLVFGSYAGKDINYIPGNYFARQRELIGEQAKASGEATDNPSVYYQIWRQAFTETLRHVAILTESDQGGLYLSDDAVDKALITYGPYQENGQFSESRYNRASTAEKYATRGLFREELTQSRYVEDTINGLLKSKAETEKLTAMASPERSFSFVSFAFTDYPQEKVVEYGSANAARFSRIKVSRILVKSGKKEADSIKARLQADPLRFEEIAKASSKDSYAAGGGAMGWQYRYDLEREFAKPETADAVVLLKQGEIGEPLEGSFGWMIYRCDDPAIAIDMSLEEDRVTVRTYIDRYEAGLVQDFTLQRAKDFVSRARQDGFAKTAKASALTVDATTSFPLNYQNVFILKPVQSESQGASGAAIALADALYSEEFFTAAFTIREGEVSEPVVLGQAVVVLSLRSERDASASDLEIMEDYYAYFAQQAAAADLEAQLLDPSKVVDKFDETYLQYLAPKDS